MPHRTKALETVAALSLLLAPWLLVYAFIFLALKPCQKNRVLPSPRARPTSMCPPRFHFARRTGGSKSKSHFCALCAETYISEYALERHTASAAHKRKAHWLPFVSGLPPESATVDGYQVTCRCCSVSFDVNHIENAQRHFSSKGHKAKFDWLPFVSGLPPESATVDGYQVTCRCCSVSFDVNHIENAQRHFSSKGHKAKFDWLPFVSGLPPESATVDGYQVTCCSCSVSFDVNHIENAQRHFSSKGHKAKFDKLLLVKTFNSTDKNYWKLTSDAMHCTRCDVPCMSILTAIKHYESPQHKRLVQTPPLHFGPRTKKVGSGVAAVDALPPDLRTAENDDRASPPPPHAPSVSHDEPIVDQDDFEHCASAAVKNMWESSPLFQGADPSPVSDEEKADLIKGFTASFDNQAIPFVCGSCGSYSFGPKVEVPIRDLAVLKASDDHVESVKRYGKYSCVMNLTEFEDEVFHLDPDCVQEGKVVMCERCEKAVRRSSKDGSLNTHMCYKTGFDLGSFRRAGLPTLTLIESQLVARVRHFSTVAKFKGFLPEVKKVCGHFISFPHDGPKVAATLPRKDVGESVAVVFVGSRSQFEARRPALAQHLRVRKEVVLQWLDFLVVVDPSYAGVHIDRDFDEGVITSDLLDGAHIADSRLVASLESFNCGPVATEEGIEHVLVTPSVADVEGYDALQSLMASVRIATQKKKTQAQVDDERIHKVPRGPHPLNEFEANATVMKGGFPHLFAVFDFSVLKDRKGKPREGTFSASVLRHWFSTADGRFAREPQFAFLAFNQLQRHSLIQQVAKTIRTGKEISMEEFIALINSDGFRERLDKAIDDPKAKDSVLLQRQIQRHVQTFSSNVPFSPMERRSCLQKIYSLFYYGGFPSIFWTLSPADMDMPRTIRLCFQASSDPKTDIASIPIPSSFVDRFEMVKSNPCYAAQTFDALISAVLEELIQTDNPSRRVLKDRKRKKGVFGSCLLNFAVVEAQGRGTLHAHGLAWTDLTPERLSIAAGTLHEAEMVSILESIVRTHVDEDANRQFRGGLEKPPSPHDGDAFNAFVNSVACTCQLHDRHTDSCFKNGSRCRYAMPCPKCHDTGAYTVFVRKHQNARGEKVATVEATRQVEPRSESDSGGLYEPKDKRPILWLTKRRTDTDTIVSGFNDVIAGCTGSNQCIMPLGGEAQATGVMFYLVKYMTKDATSLTNSLSCLREALNAQKDFSPTVDAKSRTRHVLNKFGCRVLAKCEVSAQQAFAAVCGQPSSYCSKASFSYCRVWDAMLFRTHSPEEGEDADELEAQEEANDEGEILDETESLNEEHEACSDVASEDEGQEGAMCQTEEGVVVLQHHLNYAYRGPDLEHLSLYEYTALVMVEKMNEENEAKLKAADRSANRVKNKRFLFDERHPQYGTHHQKLRSRMCPPVLCGKPCPRLNAEDEEKSGRRLRKRHAQYMVTLFVPWHPERSRKSDEVTWAEWVKKHRFGTEVQRAKFRCAQNVARGLSGRGPVCDLLNAFRTQFAAKKGKGATNQECGEEVCHDGHEDFDLTAEIEALQRQFSGQCEFVNDMVADVEEYQAHVAASVPTVGDEVNLESAARSRRTIIKTTISQPPQPDAAELHQDDINPTTVGRAVLNVTVPQNLLVPEHAQQKEHFTTLCSAVFEDTGKQFFALHGGPGSGKSILAKQILQACEEYLPGSVIPTATTGIAAFILTKDEPDLDIKGAKRSLTFQKALGYGRGKSTSKAQLAEAQARFANAKGILIDEFSMLGATSLSGIDSSLRLIMKNTLPFGGLVVILVGDLLQLPAVKQAPLLDDIEYFRKFQVLSLSSQERVKDPRHSSILSDLRHPDTLARGLDSLVSSLKELSVEDSEFVDAPVIVVTNRERVALNRALAVADAKRKGVPVLAFRLVDDVSCDEMYFFVPDGPALMNEKEPDTPLLNGMQVRLSSLSYDSKRDRQSAQRALDAGAAGDIMIVPAPSTVNVIFEGLEYAVGRREGVDRSKQSFRVDGGYSYTFHKAQGLTLDRVILQLNKRKGSSLGSLSLAALYVSVSRVRDGSNIRVLPSTGCGFEHLKSLRLPPKLVEWLTQNDKKRFRVQDETAHSAKRAKSTTIRPTVALPAVRATAVPCKSDPKKKKRQREKFPFFYKGTKNPGTACHTIAVIAALCGVAASEARLHALVHSSSTPGTVLALLCHLCTKAAHEKKDALFSLASKLGLPAPGPSAEHQCAFEVLRKVTDGIPVWREMVAYTETVEYLCPLCRKLSSRSFPRSFFEVVIDPFGAKDCFSLESFVYEEDRSHVGTMKCDLCGGEIKDVVRVFRRSAPECLVVVAQRAQLQNGPMCLRRYEFPHEIDCYTLRAVVRHVSNGTHFVTKLFGIYGMNFFADDDRISILSQSEISGDEKDFICFYVKK